MKSLKAEKVLKILEMNGFLISRQRGSHIILKNNSGITVPVPVHGKNKEVPIGTLINIVKQSGLDKKLFEE
jgi:predicted RNA binding protein YcfA (HicA-like mRNA interferase family)